MYCITINGQKYLAEKNISLIDYLRDELKLTGTKNGCTQGACGTCSVIVDGKIAKSCILKLDKLVGKNIITIEGLTDREKEVYSYAFSFSGAVQCGFCIPGMVMAAKALIDSNNNPSEYDIRKSINNNICRCTGYKKIVDAIKLSADIFSGRQSIKPLPKIAKLGVDFPRVDSIYKTLGTGLYTDDLYVDNMLYGGAVRSKYPRAIIKSIDISKALKVSGVEKIITAENLPGHKYIAHLAFISDWLVLAGVGDTTRYLGDAIVLIAATTKDAVEEAKKLIEIEYEVLEPISDIYKAKENIDLVHPNRVDKGGNILAFRHLKKGDVDTVIKNSKYVVTNTYKMPATEHAFMEPESCLAIRHGDEIEVYTGGQSVYDEQREIAEVLGIDTKKVHCKSKYVGGGFGGKEDMSVQHHTALLSWLTNKPVKMTMSRAESMLTHPKRHPMDITVTTACDDNGNITAIKAQIFADTGAYASLGGPVLERACTHASGPYRVENIDIEGYAIYTNNIPAGAFRGFGVCQSNFATEINLNELSKKVGISEWEIRYRNAVKDGDYLPNGQLVESGTAIIDTLLALKSEFEKNKFVGIACAIKNSGIGMSLSDVGRCNIEIKNSKVILKSSAACIGQGIATVMLHMASEVLELPADTFVIEEPNTKTTPDSGTTTASRQTLFTGEAVRIVSEKLKEALKTKTLKELEGQTFEGQYSAITDPLNSEKEHPKHHAAFSYATHLTILDDNGKIKKVIAAHDVGRVINPKALEGQIEGGVVMSLGYALREDYPQNNSLPTYTKYSQLKLFRSTEVPDVECILIEKAPRETKAFGAKGVGEIASIPTAASVQAAYKKYDGLDRYTLPLKNTFYNK